ncbi:uncharacterized protein LOC118745532 [Rhagoletis pomonella]|uniref:uncharacterized protein LOC118745532 n=1 Tax=Rhagoletis pomonella TaxID=28610 RepID=UPI0017843A0E|nr:uncharacterized protein LOC118745532 [Rhagoletis pomonella]
MTAFQHRTFNIQMTQDYFAHLNPLAQRIASDIKTTQSTYGQLWYTLKPSEQNDILNETLIKPEISLKYFENFSSSLASLSSNSTSSSSSSSSSARSGSRGEHILQSSPKNKEHKSCKISISGASTNSLTDSFLKQTQSLISGTLTARSQDTTLAQLHGKLKAPSSPPPPPPMCFAKTPVKQTEAKSGLVIPKKSHIKHTSSKNEVKSYAFDGRNLYTYAVQKVALKIVYDDVLGAYRDEHSRPFSYRTNSQIDLQQQYKQANLGDITLKTASDEICLLQNSPSNENTTKNRDVTKNYEQLQQELKNKLNSQLGKPPNENSINITSVNNIIYKRLYGCKDNGPANNFDANKHSTSISQQVSKAQPVNENQVTFLPKVSRCGSERMFSTDNDTANVTCLLASAPKHQNMSYAVYTDAYFEIGESALLMRNCSNSGILTASSNSSTASEEDHNKYEYDDDKTLCEDIRLLENDLNLQRGFDFLNNW